MSEYDKIEITPEIEKLLSLRIEGLRYEVRDGVQKVIPPKMVVRCPQCGKVMQERKNFYFCKHELSILQIPKKGRARRR